jgi:FixJ family two-component response regulator
MLMTDDSPRGTILLVDDNMHIRRLAKVHLERAGYTVITAADGEEGLHVYERHRSCVVLLLTDVAMPKINGLELADRVLGSGDAPYEYRDLEWLAKPFAPTELIEMVRRAMSASAQPQRAVADSAA